jgi:hypothetical protein
MALGGAAGASLSTKDMARPPPGVVYDVALEIVMVARRDRQQAGFGMGILDRRCRMGIPPNDYVVFWGAEGAPS